MATTIDHLSANHRLRVIQAFRDLDGNRFRVGFEGVIESIEADMRSMQVVIAVAHAEGNATMRFALLAKDGPRNGHMREYFEVGEYVDPPRERRPGDPPAADTEGTIDATSQAPAIPTGGLVTDPSKSSAGVARVWALAARRKFEEASAQLSELASWPEPGGERARWLAGEVAALAVNHAWDDDPAVYEWLRERSIDLWYAWGSEATGGGEGAVRAVEIRKAEKEWKSFDARRAEWRTKRRR